MKSIQKKTFIILDRDGVINQDSPDYIKSPEEWLPIPHSLEAIAVLTQLGYHVLIATNQSGLARKYYSLDMLDRIHEKMRTSVRLLGGKITDIFFCPHGPHDQCLCRKPKIGLYTQMQEKYPELNLSKTYSIGDSLRDLQAAQMAGCLPILVKTGNGEKTLPLLQHPDHIDLFQTIPVFDNLWSFSEFLRQ